MKTSEFFLTTLRETPADAELVSHQLMLRAGMIRKTTTGIYTWLPLGLRVLRKIEQIVREEMDRLGAQELLMPAVHPAGLWQQTGRWDQIGDELLRFHDRHHHAMCLAPTHEEVITDLMRHSLPSYKGLPQILYQIQTKFRDEIRPRFGVMRAREFVMKDAYSFHLDEASLETTYQAMFEAYTRIFNRLGLRFKAVHADSGNIGGSRSQEFQVLADSGEDAIIFSDSSDYAANRELAAQENRKPGDPSPDGKGTLQLMRGIEVGHIFQLGTKYSDAMHAKILNEQGKKVPLQMGCYGIGISRIVAASIEQRHDNKGIIWPDALAPFTLALVPIHLHRSERVRHFCDMLYNQLQEKGYSILFDDRKERPGVLFSDLDLMGIPHRLVVSERGLDDQTVEYKHRTADMPDRVHCDNIITFLKELQQR